MRRASLPRRLSYVLNMSGDGLQLCMGSRDGFGRETDPAPEHGRSFRPIVRFGTGLIAVMVLSVGCRMLGGLCVPHESSPRAIIPARRLCRR